MLLCFFKKTQKNTDCAVPFLLFAVYGGSKRRGRCDTPLLRKIKKTTNSALFCFQSPTYEVLIPQH